MTVDALEGELHFAVDTGAVAEGEGVTEPERDRAGSVSR